MSKEIKTLQLWDYGWAHFDDVYINPSSMPTELIKAYTDSPQFQTSFLEDNAIQENIHGPFQSSSINASDFRRVSPQEFIEELNSIRQPPKFVVAASDEQWKDVLAIAKSMASMPWLFILERTEKDKSIFHEWGFVLGIIFREFLAGAPDSVKLERLVISLD